MFQKSLSLMITIFLTGQICLTSGSVMAGSSTDYIRNACPREFDRHKATVTEFAMRMRPNVEQCGCGLSTSTTRSVGATWRLSPSWRRMRR